MTPIDLSREVIFASLGLVVSLIRYATYFRSIYRKETRPHIFSWFNWGLITAIATIAQINMGGGPSTWILGFVSATCFFVAFLAIFVGEKNITRSDWITFIGALITIPVWQATSNPLNALFVLAFIDILSYYPTVRKSWHTPANEDLFSWFLSGLRYFLAVLAIPTYAFEVVFYPFFLMSCDWGFTGYLYWRRYVCHNNKNSQLLTE